MIDKIAYVESRLYDPYKNLALEEYLLRQCRTGECILYLWQNRHTVVIGKNQNTWKECKTNLLEEDGGYVARRLSGGGAVYHDLGNLNFTFLVRKEDYDLERQLEVILKAVQRLGIDAYKSGRNDLLADGKKFSGNAFYEHAGHCYHHGTIMVDVDTKELGKYLTVSEEKLKAKGVNSVKSRVVNLSQLAEDITIENLKQALKEAFQEVYGMKASVLADSEIEQKELESLYHKFASWNWIYGKKIEYERELLHRFAWGQIELQFQVENGKIKDVGVYSDALKTEIIDELPKYLKGLRYSASAMSAELGLYWSEDAQNEEMMSDIRTWLETVEL